MELPRIPLYVFDPATGALISQILVKENDAISPTRGDVTPLAPPPETVEQQAFFKQGAWVLQPRPTGANG
ncbi:hypothetical protein [Andreprevotia chitinilytica]|uniref:hypothetical protein n=1 Tax=Andreprevotia chitinilytica TaxID=396808 RepID=UPI000554F668|nr:hypothetical protein [Andreprevotia chitinilytica]